ncbi:MAG: InlB B-repeat-containing protein, partial [Butyrivibrio sp.]
TTRYLNSDAVPAGHTYKDETAPVINSYAPGADENSGMLTATAVDSQTGITGYAFTTKKTEAELLEADWITVSATKEIQLYTYKPEETGKYYFYVKDTEGNIAKSGPIPVTIIRYNDYYENGSKKTQYQALIGDNDVTLDTGMSRPGYVLEGWYGNPEFSGTSLTNINSESHLESGFIDVYAKWKKAGVIFTTNLNDDLFTYDGNARTLEVTLDNSVEEYIEKAKDGSISYQWYKRYGEDWKKIDGEASSTLSVKNVSDAGYYYVEVIVSFTDEQDGKVEDKYSSNTAKIEILPIKLTLNVDSKNVAYLDDKPEYTYSINGSYAAGENKETAGITVDYLCDYVKGSAIGSYTIGAEAEADYGNYSFKVNTGLLTVNKKNVANTGSGVTAVLTDKNPQFVYDGNEHKPDITVEDNNAAIDATQYDIEYSNCVAAGTATATITFKGNYTGSKTVVYTIQKADFKPVVSINGWSFGNTPDTPVTASNVSGGEETFYYYKKGEDYSAATTSVPVNAGEYYVYVKVAKTGNYNEQDSLTDGTGTPFTISPKVITITTQSGSWIYDGNTHIAPGYNVVGEFVGTDDFKNIVITGSITDVGTCKNTVEYTLTSSTIAGNYDIRMILGDLTINSTQLAMPANPAWDSDHPGRAVWVAVTRDNLIVSYRVQLYRVTESGYEPVGSPAEVNTTYIDYKDIIKNDCKTQNGSQSYVFDVAAIPCGGAAKGNYTESEATDVSGPIGTVLVSVGKDSGIDTVTINGESGPVYLLEDETATVESTLETGYTYASPIWTVNSSYLTITDKNSGKTTVKVMDVPEASGNSVNITANSVDKIPVITDFSASLIENNSKVLFSFGARDELNITGWMINSSSIAPGASDEGWVNVNADTITIDTDQGSNVVSDKGSYYLWVKDSNGSVVGVSSPINIYRIKFEDGGGTGTMADILKIQNIDVRLPELAYERAGYYFKNWSSSTGIYINGGVYSANKDDTLTATWTDQAVSYEVWYYYMNADGTYSDACESTASFNAYYGELISPGSNVIQAARTGFETDTDKFISVNGTDSVGVYESGTVIKLFYKRIQYKLTYMYVIPKSGEIVSFDIDVLYGAEVTEREAVNIPGYDFVGWSYGEAGSKPETMPNKNITAMGTYAAQETEYVINYYGQNVDCGNTYTLLQEYTETKKCLHDDFISYGIEDAREITGYTVQGIAVSHGNVSGSDISSVSVSNSCGGEASAVSGEKLYINIYYLRNRHSITLNVWKGTRGIEGNNIYSVTWDDIPYGYAFTGEEINTYKTYYEVNYKEDYENDESKGLSGFTLARYTDWSTGSSPSFMPDGDVTISKDYVIAGDSRYYIEVFTESEDGSYSRMANMVCYSSVGKYIRYNNDSDAIDSLDNYITYNELKNNMPSLTYYQYNPKLSDPDNEEYSPDVNGEGCIEGYVTDVDVQNEDPMILRIYFERKTVTTGINYYYANEDNSSAVKMYTITKTGKWGTKYSIEADAFFDGNTDDRSSESTEYWSDSNKGTVTSVRPGTVTIDGIDVNLYDFRNNVYSVSYDEHHALNGAYHYTSKTFLEAADFEKSYTAIFGYGSNYVNIYYVKVNTDKTYYMDVLYRTNNLHSVSQGEDVQLTCTIDGNTYKVRLANEKDIFEGSSSEVTLEAGYPAGNSLRQMMSPLQGEKTLKDGYTAQSVTTDYGTDTYYINGSYIYIADTRNHLFYGNRASVNLGNPKGATGGINHGAAAGYSDIVDYLKSYKEDADNPDSAKDGAYIYNGGFGSVLYSKNDSYNYVYTFAYTDTYSLTFSLNGDTRTNEEKYVYDRKFTLEELERFANIHFTAPTGKRIVLYEDAQCTTPVSSEYILKGNTVIYCRYEKAIYDNKYYISYELPNAVSIGGEDTYYIDRNNYEDALLSAVFDENPDVSSEDITLINEYGLSVICPKTTTSYSINGNLALVVVTVPGFANSEVSMTYSDYGQTGYYYDDANSQNTSNGYCMTEGVSLAAYYARYRYTFTLDNNNAKINNTITYIYPYGREVELTEPARNGYTFAGWEWTFSDTDLAWDSGISEFIMPTQNVTAVARWTPAYFTGGITHYFQTETQTYDTTGLAGILNSETVTSNACTIRMSDDFISEDHISEGKLYYEADSLIGASFEYDGRVCYFSTAAEKQGYYEVEASDLIAMTQPMTEKSEEEIPVSKYAMPESSPFASIFTYTFTVCSEDSTIERHGLNDTFTANAAMDVAYYYTRSYNNNIRALGMATDNATAGITITGTGDHYYGENVTLSAVLSGGYDFVGWYNAEDVLVRYDGDVKFTYGQDLANGEVTDLSVYKLDTEYDFNNALGNDISYGFKVTGPKVYVAVVSPLLVDGTSAEIVCDSKDITYGDVNSTENSLKLNINLGNENVVVKGYRWYVKEGNNWIPIEGATSGVYNLDTSINAGTYMFKCELSLMRSDNERTAAIVTEPFEITVNKANMNVVSKSYEGVYDGLEHGITININKPGSPDDYIIYYSHTEITESTDLSSLSTDAGSFKEKDVNYDGVNKNVLTYDVYYYIKDKTGNYTDYKGHETIKITPKAITVKAATSGFSYSKIYDGYTRVRGEISDGDSDKGRLANGINGNTFYIITGIVSSDLAIENATYIIDFDADYNYSHVSTATAVTLTNMKLVTVMGDEYIDNYNYSFSTSSTLTLSAYITPYPIETNWDENNVFTYDGNPHRPDVTIGSPENIPDGAENIVLNISGEQVNAGNYYAGVTIGIKDGVTDVYSSDYKARTAKKEYSIAQRTLTVTPSNLDEDINKIYNGGRQTINKFTVDGLVPGELVEYSPNTSIKNVGTVQIKAANVKVFTADEKGNKSKDITDNYAVICPEQTFTISKKPVTVSKITAEDKVYDGNLTAVLHSDKAVISGVIDGDVISINEDCLLGTFEDSAVGNYINRVGISIVPGKRIEDILGGADADNYIIDWDSDATIKKASAQITKAQIDVKVNNVTEIYGETPEFTVSYEGFLDGDTESLITG